MLFIFLLILLMNDINIYYNLFGKELVILVKIIFSDFDDTLIDYYDSNGIFSNYSLDVLKRVKDRGIKFIIVTGRPICFFYGISNLLSIVDYIIASNGAEIYNVKEKEVIYYKGIDKFVFEQIFDYCRQNKIRFLVNSGVKRYYYGEGDNGSSIFIKNNNVDYINQVIFLLNDKCEFEELKYFLIGIKEIKLSNIVYNEERCSIDINEKSVSKGNSIQYLCDLLKIDIEDTIAFGDSDNDISMFEVVGKSICVGNATDVIKQLVDEVIDDCNYDGVFKYIDDNILK